MTFPTARDRVFLPDSSMGIIVSWDIREPGTEVDINLSATTFCDPTQHTLTPSKGTPHAKLSQDSPAENISSAHDWDVAHKPNLIGMATSHLPEGVMGIAFYLSIYDPACQGDGFHQIENVRVHIAETETGIELACYDVGPFDEGEGMPRTAVCLGQLQRVPCGKWLFEAQRQQQTASFEALLELWGFGKASLTKYGSVRPSFPGSPPMPD